MSTFVKFLLLYKAVLLLVLIVVLMGVFYLKLTVKRASKTVYQVIHSAQANATHNHGFDADRLIVAEAFVSKGLFKKRVLYHAKGRSGVRVRPECD
ncbi:putative ribosomal protein L22/L17 [Helianthus annuus]|nr:putative ribosomal protein L22/L17 [Helianthus annuus]